MLQSGSLVESVRPSSSTPLRLGRLIVPRPRLTARLDAAIRTSSLVIVDGEAGSGKTTLVSAWVGRPGDRSDVHWCSLRHGRPAMASLGNLAAGCDSPRLVVVDDVPADPDDELNSALERLLLGSDPGVRVVLLSAGNPALDIQRLGAGAECQAVGPGDLALDLDEIADLLTRFGNTAKADLVAAIGDRTRGWAWGARRVASRLAQGAPTSEALHEADLAIAGLLENSILRGLSSCERRLITETSMVAEVTAEHVARLVGEVRVLSADAVTRTRGFVRVRADGSFSTHPLLRRHLLDQLRRTPASANIATRNAVRCAVDSGDLTTAIDIYLDAADWAAAAELLVESLQIPRLLTVGTASSTSDEVVDGLGSVDPLLKAAAALGRSWPDVAAQALRELPPAESRPEAGAGAAPASICAQLSRALVAMALARWEGDAVAGQLEHRRAAALLPQLSAARRTAAPALAPLLHAHLAAFDVVNGAPDRAKVALERGSRAFRSKPTSDTDSATQIAAADCLGQLAWLEAIGGSLTSALHRAAAILTARPADSAEIGVIYAQLATIWCEISRIELKQATQRFESLAARYPAGADAAMLPELAAATGLTAARLSGAVGYGRIGYETRQLCRSMPGARVFEQQLQLIRAEAELESGEPVSALRLLGEGHHANVDAYVLRARAWIQLGDRAAVAAALRVRPVEAVSVLTQVELELIEGWLAQAHGDRARVRSLVDRALKTAQREQLRAPISWAKPWIQDIVTADPGLLQRYGPFLASIRRNHDTAANSNTWTVSTAAPMSALTERELDILQRLGALSTNEEIAAELYLSPNTIKTHLRSLYRKLDVTRRSDAFRRGRALGLC